MTLEGVEAFSVPEGVIAKTERSLRRAGRDGYELFVLWSGTHNGSSFRVETAHVPEQTSYRRKGGLCVRVEGEALHKLNVWLFEHKETLGAQVHAHPTDAYHSGTDDTFPIVTTLGGLSLVVPDFCRAGLFAGSAAYRLSLEGWREDSRPVTRLIQVV
ncbi:MAG TPA: hypothetical protein VK488_04165 [Gaiellaceae bacterium]|nr:hypothetical protein [Gaiellaceae bacterium]